MERLDSAVAGGLVGSYDAFHSIRSLRITEEEPSHAGVYHLGRS